jgi:endonuclease YncB( thermonuclease family)
MRLFPSFLLILFFTSTVFAQRAWRELDGIRLVEQDANDGDSFHARRNSTRYFFRLYFVDTAETDLRFEDRVQEQADYFGVTIPEVMKGADQATEYVRGLLEGKDFTVFTRYEDARGASNMKRHFAMVRVGDRWLCELLVENGHARIFGKPSDLPDDTPARTHWARLRRLEAEAKEAHRGTWGIASGKIAVDRLEPGQTIQLPSETAVFQMEPPHQLVGNLPEGWEVKTGAVTRAGFREISFTSPGGSDFTGEIQESSLK